VVVLAYLTLVCVSPPAWISSVGIWYMKKGKIVSLYMLSRQTTSSLGVAALILILGTVWRWVVSFVTWLAYQWGKSRWYPVNGWWAGFRGSMDVLEKRKTSWTCQDLIPWAVQHVAQTLCW
jgi:hypothetical protein